MAKWEIEDKGEGNEIDIWLLRNGSGVGFVDGFIKEPAAGPNCFLGLNILVEKEYQREYMKAHNGVKMGAALGWELLKMLKKKGVSYIQPYGVIWRGERFINRAISIGIIEKTPGGLLKINLEEVPATEEALTTLVGKMRANEAKVKADARAAKIKRAREWAKRLFRRTRPK